MKKYFFLGAMVAILIVTGAFLAGNGSLNGSDKTKIQATAIKEIQTPGAIESIWRSTMLTDIKTGEPFKIEDYDKPILLESFAVWCPTCKVQQDQIKKLIEDGDESIHISINTDPNENEENVMDHLGRHGYNWKYAVFPEEATASLIEEFGVGVVNAPGAPIIIICPGKDGKLLKRGVKTSEELKTEINKC